MKVINVYERYFEAKGVFNGVPRNAANLQLVSTSDAGQVFYEIVLSFFPYRDPTDFAISYDAVFTKEIYRAKGRRSKKRETGFLQNLQKEAALLAKDAGAEVFFDRPLIEARLG